MWPGEGCWPAADMRTLGISEVSSDLLTPWGAHPGRGFKTLNTWVRGSRSPVPRNTPSEFLSHLTPIRTLARSPPAGPPARLCVRI